LKDVKIAGKESYFLEKFNNRLREFVKTNARRQTYSEAPVWLLETAGFFAITVTIVLMFTLMQSEPVRVFSLIALLAVTAWRVLPAVNRIVRTATHLRVVLPFIEKILEYLEPDPPETTRNECIDLAASSSPETTVSFRHKIRFQDVSFSYDGGEETVLSNISCSFYKGNIYAVIGKSGAGKSTFVDLLSGMLVPDGGHIFIDDLPLTSAGMLLSWRKNIGYVPQHPYLIDATVAENIAFGIPAGEIEMHRVRACCEQACIDFLRDLPDGIDTNVGDRGIRLSGGQRQRIAIARALYRGPDLLILDEATNAVDEKSEELIYSSLHAMKKNRVILIVAHRLSTRARVDSILRLDAGKTVDTVRHARS
jgi:ABC-type bacteriocin/lantibiotic exporter with double-glycine peptidase domain